MSTSRRTDPATARLTGWIQPVVDAAGYDLEELVVTPAGRRSVVRVVVDRDQGVSLDDVAEVSRAVSAALDENVGELGGAPCVLEVTGPGVDRPLAEQRHWRRNAGRLVRVSLKDGSQVAGRIQDADDEGAEVLTEQDEQTRVSFADVSRARIEVEVRRAEDGDD